MDHTTSRVKGNAVGRYCNYSPNPGMFIMAKFLVYFNEVIDYLYQSIDLAKHLGY